MHLQLHGRKNNVAETTPRVAATLSTAPGGRTFMRLPHTFIRVLVLSAVGFAASIGLIEQAAAEEPELQALRAPFTCNTEWSGATRSGHGLNNWNLDINRTSRTFSNPQHDLGQPLLAQGSGTIVWIGRHVSAGTYVEIDYGEITVRYIHLVDDSVPDGLDIESDVAEGQLFGLLGDTGNATHAHLHLEYFDSRDYDDARAYLLPATNQIQIAIDGEPIDPGEAFTSTNCDGDPPPATTTTPTEPSYPFGDVDTDSFAYEDIALLFDLAVTTGMSETTYAPGHDVTREQMAAFLGRMWRILAPAEPEPQGGAGQPEPPTSLPYETFPFDDVDRDSFAYDDIALIFELGITTGTGATTYSPADVVTREQMAAFLARMWDLLNPEDPPAETLELQSFPTPDPYPFDDIDPSSFAYGAIAQISQLGITTGTSEMTYSPTDDVTREQMAAFLARLYRLTSPG
jgi:hypothetical protein